MSKYDLNAAKKQGERTIIPPGVYTLIIHVRPGGCGDEGLLRLAKNLSSLLLELELTVVGGEHEGNSFRHFMTVAVDTGEEATAKQRKAIEWGLSTLRAILESACKIKPDDQSDEALRRRQFNSFSHFDYLEFIGRVGTETSDQYGEQNKLLRVVCPGDRDWPGEETTPTTPTTPSGPHTNSGAIALPAPPMSEEMDDSIPF